MYRFSKDCAAPPLARQQKRRPLDVHPSKVGPIREVGVRGVRASGLMVALSLLGAQSVAGQSGPPLADCPVVGAVVVDPEQPSRVFPAAEYLEGPKPVYPPALRARRLTGMVALRFVVGCTGRVDSSSVRVMQATDSAFIRPAIEVVLKSTYRPAVLRGRKVAVPMEQIVRFVPKATE